MNKIQRKLRKLISNPNAFFRDSKYFNPKIQKEKNEKKPAIEKIKFVSATTKKTPKIKVYLSEVFTSSPIFRNHVSKILNGLVDLECANFRLKPNEILFSTEDEFLLANLNDPVENEILVKGKLLVSISPEIAVSEDFKAIKNVIHKINVEHMKTINDFNMLYYYYSDREESTEQSLVKYALLAGIYDESVILRALKLMSHDFSSLTQGDSILFFRKLYRVLGTDGRLEKIADNFANQIKKNNYPVHFIMNLAAFFTESGSYEKALDMAGRAKARDRNAWFNHRYLGLTYLLVESKLLKEEWALKESEVFLLLRKNEWEFENYIRDHLDNVCLVGNSPIELGKNKGEKIDSVDKVVRFNGAVVDYPYCLDYGRKTNILVINPRYYETQRNNKYDLDFIIISDGNLYSSKNIIYKVHDLFQFTDKVCFMPKRHDLTLTQNIEASPSSGLKLIHWIYNIMGSLDRNNLFGFSLNDQGHGIATSYSTGRRVGLNTIHDWDKEKAFLDSMIIDKSEHAKLDNENDNIKVDAA
ncbi:glycosyltransferase family 29 protein [Escherichia coli]|nr:glycosyltransferase family 29 protein [Escherichia coli]